MAVAAPAMAEAERLDQVGDRRSGAPSEQAPIRARLRVTGSDRAMSRLSDRPVLVTGAAGAIGAAICQAILDAGGEAIGCDLTRGEHVEHILDVTREDEWQATIGRIVASGRSLTGLVNAAGVFVRGTVAETDVERFTRVMAVNLDGTFLGCKHAMPPLARHGGSIVNLSSIFGRVGRHDMIA